MKRWMSGWVVAGTMVLGTAALAQSTGGAGEQQQMDHSKHGGDMKAAQAGSSDPLASAKQLLGEDEKGFMQRMHFANKTEIELSQLALQKSQNKDVQKLAQMLVDDHTKADQQLTQLAQKAGNTLDDSEPKAANDTERAVMDAKKAMKAKLQALEGKSFDQAWLTGMVDSHDTTLAKNMAALEQFKSNKELTQMLTQMAPKLMKHREMAYDALGKAKPTMRQARTSGANR